MELLSSKPLQKTPITYIPTNEPVTDELLNQLAVGLGVEWTNVASELGVKRCDVAMLLRNAQLQGQPLTMVKNQILEMWVKMTAKEEDKVKS